MKKLVVSVEVHEDSTIVNTSHEAVAHALGDGRILKWLTDNSGAIINLVDTFSKLFGNTPTTR
jgi:hypothetical protein